MFLLHLYFKLYMHESCHHGASLFTYSAYRFLFRCWIENPTAIITQTMMITNSPTTVKVIPTVLLDLCTMIGLSVGVVVSILFLDIVE